VLNWNWVIQACGALGIYLALVGAYLANMSPLAFALYSAICLCLSLSLYASANQAESESNVRTHAVDSLEGVFPSIAESVEELHTLQNEINELQAQFAKEKLNQQPSTLRGNWSS